MITVERLKELVCYDSDTGILTARIRRGKTIAGSQIGYVVGYGRMKVCLDRKEYMVHRLAWLYVYGIWPSKDIDHRNGNPADNRISNLREATDSQNLGNMKKPITNKSGYKGVSWHGIGKKWQVHIKIEGVNKYLGLYVDLEEAHRVYAAAAIEFRGEFGRAE